MGNLVGFWRKFSGEFSGEFSGQFCGEFSGELIGKFSAEFSGKFVGKFSIPEGLSAGPHRLQRPSQDFHRSKCAAWYWSQVLHCDTRQPRTCTETVGSLWYRV